MATRRTLKQYVDLFRNPRALFKPNASSNGAAVTLWPNGQAELWIQDSSGHGYRITASEGPAGFALAISTFIGSPPMTVSGNIEGNYDVFAGPDLRHMEICQYKADDKSQTFKRWYQLDSETRQSLERPAL